MTNVIGSQPVQAHIVRPANVEDLTRQLVIVIVIP
jgi:hypothetical protein